MEIKDAIKKEVLELSETLLNKNENYGNAAFFAPLFNELSPIDALYVRLSDKVFRLHSLRNGVEDKVNESIRDTLKDLAGYAILILASEDVE